MTLHIPTDEQWQDLANRVMLEAEIRRAVDSGLRTDVDRIDTAINKTVVSDIDVDSNPSTSLVQLDASRVNIKTSSTTTKSLPLPVASSTQAGVMNSATFDAVAANTNNIAAMSNGAVAITGISATPTQSDLTTAWQTETGLTTLINRANIYDVDNDKIWTYYTNTSTWYASQNTPSITINTFTNSSEGTIKGSTNVGQVFAESDGTGSVNGWDTLSSTVADHTSALAGLATVATSGSYLDLTDTPTAVSDFVNDAGYTTETYVDTEVAKTWQLIGSAVVEGDYTGNDVCSVSIPAEWQGDDVEYKFSLSLEHIGAAVDAYPYLMARNEEGWMNCRFSYVKTDGNTTLAYEGLAQHFGLEWDIRHTNDSCVAEGIIGHPADDRRYWNISCHAGGIRAGLASTYIGGGRASGGSILEFKLHSSVTITWSNGTYLEIYARKIA